MDWTLRLTAVCGLLWWVSAALANRVFVHIPYGIGSLVVLVVVWIVMCLPRIGVRWRLGAVLVFSVVVNLLGLVSVGLAPGNAILIFVSVLVASLYWGLWAGFAACGAIAATIAAVAYGWHRGVFPLPSFAASLDFTLASTWMRIGIATMSGAIAVTLLFEIFFRRLRAAVTELSTATVRLRESEARYRILFEQAGDHVLVLELRAGAVPIVVDANEAAVLAYGYARAELLGQPISVIEPGATEDRHLERMRQLESGETSLFEIRHQRKDGTWLDVEVQSRLADLGGKQIIISVERDVTERRKAEEQIAMLKHSIDAHYDGAYWIDRNHRFVYINDAGCKAFGYSREEMIGRSVADFNPRATPAALETVWAHLKKAGFFAGESVHRRKDGTEFPVEIITTYVQFGGREYSCGFARDITVRKNIELALRASEQRYQTLFERMLDGFALHEMIFDDADEPVDYRYLAVNPAFERMTGLSASAVVGRRVREVMDGSDLSRIKIYGQVVRSGEPCRFESPAPELGRDFEVLAFRPQPGQFACFIQDVSDRKRLEQQLVHSQKMEAIGQLAGGVAHDFNNILAATMMNLGLLRMDPALSPEVQTVLTELETGARRAADLTRQLLMFSRRQPLQVRPIDLDDVLGNLLQMLRRLIGEDIQLMFAGSAAPHWIEADTGMIEQVITNLCVNARDAMPNGGTLTLASGEAVIDEHYKKTHSEAQIGRFVTLRVTDTGRGMDEGTLKRIFEPFFTTKEVGKGTGLGLAIVYGVVAQHRGWVEVRSAVGKGSTFEVFLPASLTPDGIGSRPACPPVAGGHEIILLVEDEAAVRQIIRACLQRYGYRIVEAESGIKALEIWEEQAGRIDLLFTDMIMPEGLNGLQLAERLRAKKPALKVIIASGYNAEKTQPPDANSVGFRYLGKPFEVQTLAATVRAALDASD